MLSEKNKVLKEEYQKIKTFDDMLKLSYDIVKENETKTDLENAYNESSNTIYQYLIGKYQSEEQFENYFSNFPLLDDIQIRNDREYEYFRNIRFALKSHYIYDVFAQHEQHFVKLYFSVEPEHYIEVVGQMIEVIRELQKENNDELPQSQLRTTPSKEAGVLRVQNQEVLDQLIEKLDQVDFLNKQNDHLFLPTYKGYPIINDNGGTYYGFLSYLLTDYVYECIDQNQEVQVESFINYIKTHDYKEDPFIIKVCKGFESTSLYRQILLAKLNQIDNDMILSEYLGIQKSKEQPKKLVLKK